MCNLEICAALASSSPHTSLCVCQAPPNQVSRQVQNGKARTSEIKFINHFEIIHHHSQVNYRDAILKRTRGEKKARFTHQTYLSGAIGE